MEINKERLEELKPSMVALLDIPFDDYSSYLKGAAAAPPVIREALYNESSNLCAENGIDLGTNNRFFDLGETEFKSGKNKYEQIEEAVLELIEREVFVLTIGGDHSITYPVIKAYASKYECINILHFDAHPDLYDIFDDNPNSHACPMARIMENELAENLVQVGIRTMNPHQREQADKFGVKVMNMNSSAEEIIGELKDPLYISLDMDVLDPAFAPGISHYAPGGLSTRDVLNIIQNIQTLVIGADIVEYNPTKDVNNVTAVTAAKFVKEIASKMMANK